MSAPMRLLALSCALLLLVVPAGVRAQAKAEDRAAIEAQVKAVSEDLRRHAESGDCGYIDEFVDQNLDEDGVDGAAARLYAVLALIKPGPSGKDPQRCRYSDRKVALGVAIDFYSMPAEGGTARWQLDAMAQLALADALGKSWTEKLANAGVTVAMEDLVALHLTCVAGEQQGPIAFWVWLDTDPSTGSRSRGMDADDLQIYASNLGCRRLSVPASIGEACYWNALETASFSASDREPVSVEMGRLGERIMGLPRVQATVLRAMDNNGRTDFDAYGPALRKLIAEGCAATLPPAALEEIRRRAAMGAPSSEDELIDGFE